jgi:hypothetical protein
MRVKGIGYDTGFGFDGITRGPFDVFQRTPAACGEGSGCQRAVARRR